MLICRFVFSFFLCQRKNLRKFVYFNQQRCQKSDCPHLHPLDQTFEPHESLPLERLPLLLVRVILDLAVAVLTVVGVLQHYRSPSRGPCHSLQVQVTYYLDRYLAIVLTHLPHPSSFCWTFRSRRLPCSRCTPYCLS